LGFGRIFGLIIMRAIIALALHPFGCSKLTATGPSATRSSSKPVNPTYGYDSKYRCSKHKIFTEQSIIRLLVRRQDSDSGKAIE